MYFLIRKYLCNKYIAKNVVCFLKKMLYVSWLWSLYVGVQGCGFKMFRAVARGNDSPKETDVGMAENDLILIACLIWKQEKYMIEYLLHAVGPCWRRCLSCCYSWPCNLLLNCSIPPKASFSSLCQFKLGVDWFTSGRYECGEKWDFSLYKSANHIFLGDLPLFIDSVKTLDLILLDVLF